MAVHELKTERPYFGDVASGRKNFDVRRTDDRTFSVGDLLVLVETSEGGFRVTGARCERVVEYVLEGPPYLPKGTCVMGLRDTRGDEGRNATPA